MIDTLCTAKSCIARKTCARYRLIPRPHSQSYADFNDWSGLRCPYRSDVAMHEPRKLRDWREVDKEFADAKSKTA
jgi:hypothetical protein